MNGGRLGNGPCRENYINNTLPSRIRGVGRLLIIEELTDVVHNAAASSEILRSQSYVVRAFADLEVWTVVAAEIWVCYLGCCCDSTELTEQTVVSLVVQCDHLLDGGPEPSGSTNLGFG